MSPDRWASMHQVLGRRCRAVRLAGPREEADDLAPADLVERDAVGDLVQPRAGVLGLLERVVVLVRLDERVLGQVGGELGVAHHAQEVGVDLAVVLGEQRLDERRGLVVVPRAAHRRRLAAERREAAEWTREGLRGRVDDHEDSERVRCSERGRWAAHARWPRDDGPRPGVTPAPATGRRASPGAVRRRLGATEQLLDGVLGRDRVDRQAGSQLQPGDLAQARVDLPVPVVRGVDLLAQRAPCGGRGCRAGRRGSPTSRPSTWRSASAVARDVGRRVARPKSASWCRGTIQISNGEREAYGANATLACVLPDEPVRPARLRRGRAGRTGTRPRG